MEKTVNGRPALTNPSIDGKAYNCRKKWLKTKFADYDNWKEWNNADLMGEGYPPRDDNVDPYELHHIGQRQDSPFAELTYWQHMTDGNNAILPPSVRARLTASSLSTKRLRTGWRGMKTLGSEECGMWSG